MTERLEKIFSVIPECQVFADVGCDHGYLAKAVLKSGKCKKVILSDVSEKCLQKAKDLLCEEIQNQTALAVVSDGFDNLPKCDCALIAGMGGEEIISILKKAKSLPDILVLQPMKNTDKVRVTTVELGYQVLTDFTFQVGRIFYDLMVLKVGKDSLTPQEIAYGRTNLQTKPIGFKNKIKSKINSLSAVLKSPDLSDETVESIKSQIRELENYV